MRAVARLFGRQHAIFYISGIAVSWLCFVLAMVALYYLARLDLPPPLAERAVLLTMIFPFSFFFGVVYSESTFLLFAVLAFYFFRTRRWVAGGVCGAFATATRVPGIMLLAPLAWLAWQHAQPTRRDRMAAALGLVLAAAGFGAYCLYIYRLTGDPLEWVATLQRWGYYPGGAPWMTPVGSDAAAGDAPVPDPDDRADGGLRHAVRRHRRSCSRSRFRSYGGASARRTACSCC